MVADSTRQGTIVLSRWLGYGLNSDVATILSTPIAVESVELNSIGVDSPLDG